jgi:hypothetical protein
LLVPEREDKHSLNKLQKHDKQDQQGKAAFNERNPITTQQQEPRLQQNQTKIGIFTLQYN